MRLQLKKIDRGDGTIDIIWQTGNNQYARTVAASEVDTRAKLGAYILSQMVEMESSQTYILEAHRDNGAWVLDSFTGDDDRDVGRGNIKTLPGWATWDGAAAELWVEENVTNLATAKTAIKALARMAVFLRDSVL